MNDDLISRQSAIKALEDAGMTNYLATGDFYGIINALTVIKNLPTAEPMTGLYVDGFNDGYKAGKEDAEPRKGKWKISDLPKGQMKYCSECGFGQYIADMRTYHYCPNCGARMEET